MMSKVLFLTFIFTWNISCLFSQISSAVTPVSATVVEPITITKSVALNFESVAIIIAGSVELVPLDARGSSATINLPVTSGTFTAASFVVAGSTAYTYKITVPSSPVEVAQGKDKLIVRSFDSDPILNPDSELLAGVFVSVSPMNVTVNYN
jgi:hypothetical protein